MTIPPRAAERVTWPEGCPVPVYRDTGTMVQALNTGTMVQALRYYNDGLTGEVIPARKLNLPQLHCDLSTIADS